MFDAMIEDLFSDEDMTQAATYTPDVGAPVDCRVVLSLGQRNQPMGLEAQMWGSETTIEYRLDDVGREADAGETFVVDGTTYAVADALENDGFTVKVSVK